MHPSRGDIWNQLYQKTKLKTLCKWHYVRIFVLFANFMIRIERVEGQDDLWLNKTFDSTLFIAFYVVNKIYFYSVAIWTALLLFNFYCVSQQFLHLKNCYCCYGLAFYGVFMWQLYDLPAEVFFSNFSPFIYFVLCYRIVKKWQFI